MSKTFSGVHYARSIKFDWSLNPFWHPPSLNIAVATGVYYSLYTQSNAHDTTNVVEQLYAEPIVLRDRNFYLGQ